MADQSPADLPAEEPLRVVIADDHPLYRKGLGRFLAEAGIEVVGEAPNGTAAIEVTQQTAPDVVVMDLQMPGIPGVEATRILRERSPATRVLVVTASELEEDLTTAILAGATGYIVKGSQVDEVVAGIRAAAAGECLISPRIASTLLGIVKQRQEAAVYPPSVELSAREVEVLKLVADGKSNHEIGQALFISPSTVRNHISSILMKLQVDNRVQAAVRAVRDRIV
jgi:DNA-binding NarL/FixJ family response regulator